MCRAKDESGRRCTSSTPEYRRAKRAEAKQRRLAEAVEGAHTPVVDLPAEGRVWRDILVEEGFSDVEASEWVTHPGIEYPLDTARKWRGYALPDAVAWSKVISDRAEADVWRSAGWEPDEYATLNKHVTERVLAAATDYPDVFAVFDAEDAEMGAWRGSGIPGSRALLYVRAGFTVLDAVEMERTHPDPDGALRTLAAFGGI